MNLVAFDFKKIQEDKIFTILIFLLLAFLYVTIFISFFTGVFGNISYSNFGKLTIPSLFLFVIVLFFSLYKVKYFFLLLLPVLLAFPAPVDDIFPSVFLTNPDDSNVAAFPLITRIDVYLLLIIVFQLQKTKNFFSVLKYKLTTKIFVLLYILIFFISILKSNDVKDFYLLLSYTYHIRYFILLSILMNIINIFDYSKEIIYGFIISIFFLLLEAFVNSKLNNSDRLYSGSLSLNTFANIAAAIGVFIYYLIKNKIISKFLGFLSIVVVLVILLGSATRGAFLSAFLSLFILNLIENPKKAGTKLLKISALVILVVAVYLKASSDRIIPDRYSYQKISEKISFDLSGDKLVNIIKIKRSWETNSIIARLNLFDSSINMIKENPLAGIGAGRWNKYKNTYSENKAIDKVLIDSHNDYLAMLSQYGIPLGLLFSYLMFFYPIKGYYKTKLYTENGLQYLFVISFTMGIAAMSNSGFFKHQISAVLMLIFCVTNNILNKSYEN